MVGGWFADAACRRRRVAYSRRRTALSARGQVATIALRRSNRTGWSSSSTLVRVAAFGGDRKSEGKLARQLPHGRGKAKPSWRSSPTRSGVNMTPDPRNTADLARVRCFRSTACRSSSASSRRTRLHRSALSFGSAEHRARVRVAHRARTVHASGGFPRIRHGGGRVLPLEARVRRLEASCPS